MVLPNESTTPTETISGFLQAIRSSSILSERQIEKLEANIADGRVSLRASRAVLTPGQG